MRTCRRLTRSRLPRQVAGPFACKQRRTQHIEQQAGHEQCAAGNIVTRALGRFGPMDQQAFVVWACLVPPLPFLALSYTIEGPQAMEAALLNFHWPSLAALAYLAWAATLFGYGVWTRMLARYPTNRVAPFSLLVPLVGLSSGWLVFGEALQAVHLIGGALLMVGLLLNLFGARFLVRKVALALP